MEGEFMIEEDRIVFALLLLIFVLNFVYLDNLTTYVALDKGCYESNFVLDCLNIDVLQAKLLGALFVCLTAVWVYGKNKEFALKTMLFFTGFSAGIVLNNVLNILGGYS